MTKFAAMTNEEFRETVLMKEYKYTESQHEYVPTTRPMVPTSVNWVSKGAVTPVSD
jgi:hypothetical protein